MPPCRCSEKVAEALKEKKRKGENEESTSKKQDTKELTIAKEYYHVQSKGNEKQTAILQNPRHVMLAIKPESKNNFSFSFLGKLNHTISALVGVGTLPKGVAVFFNEPRLDIESTNLNYVEGYIEFESEETMEKWIKLKPQIKYKDSSAKIIFNAKYVSKEKAELEFYPPSFEVKLTPGQTTKVNFDLNDKFKQEKITVQAGELPTGVTLVNPHSLQKLSKQARFEQGGDRFDVCLKLSTTEKEEIYITIKPKLGNIDDEYLNIIVTAKLVGEDTKIVEDKFLKTGFKVLVVYNDTYAFYMTPTTKFGDLNLCIEEKFGIKSTQVRLVYEGRRVIDDDTPIDVRMDMKNSPILEMFLCACGC